jgi:adhesin transport system membrane fusion protein
MEFRRVSGRNRADPTRHLTQPLVLEDGRTPRLLSRTLFIVSGFILAMAAWATFSEIRETTFASGQIVPSGQVHIAHHLDGGIVAELLVREGDRVVEGQPLIKLEPIAAASDLEQLQVRRASQMLQIARLDAEAREALPQFGAVGTAYPELAAEQARLHASSMNQRRQERATLTARVAQRRHEVSTQTAALETAKAQVPLARDLFEIQSQLISQGLTSRKNYVESRSALLRFEGERTTAETKLRTALEAQAEAESALAQADALAAQKIAEERAKATADLAEIEQQIAKLTDRLERVVVRAPSTGLVQEIVPKAAREVVKPGDVLVRIVPTDHDLVAEVRIDARDAGHVQVGMHADVKFSAYDPALFGTLSGTVTHVSATTFSPQLGQAPPAGHAASEPYYKAIIRLSSNHVGSGARERPINPGMVVQAGIVTGSKSIVRYLFKPISNSFDVAFTER